MAKRFSMEKRQLHQGPPEAMSHTAFEIRKTLSRGSSLPRVVRTTLAGRRYLQIPKNILWRILDFQSRQAMWCFYSSPWYSRNGLRRRSVCHRPPVTNARPHRVDSTPRSVRHQFPKWWARRQRLGSRGLESYGLASRSRGGRRRRTTHSARPTRQSCADVRASENRRCRCRASPPRARAARGIFPSVQRAPTGCARS